MSIPNIPERINQIITAFSRRAYDETIELIEPLLALIGHEAALHNIAGAAYAGAGRLDDAILSYDRAITLQPGFVEAHSNRGVALREQGRLAEALESHDEAIRLQPDFAAAHYGRSNVLHDLQQLEDALAGFDRVVALCPGHADALINRGNVLQQLGRLTAAVESFDMAIRARPDSAIAHVNRGNCLHELKRLDEALTDYRAAVALEPGFAEAAGRLIFLKAHMCDWTEEALPVDIATLGIDGTAVTPFNLLALDPDPVANLRRSQRWAAEKYPRAVRKAVPQRARPERLKIGYFSADLQNHATMWLMGSLFGAHDRERFEVHVFSYGPDSRDAMRQQAIKGADNFRDVRMLNDAAIADLGRTSGIDIAVDLKGYTQDSRLGIFAHGAAPIQMSYLGYPGSLGAEFIDYVVADAVVIPAERRDCYSEKILSLPHSYQVNDRLRPIAAHVPSREALGLPRDAFVFCCFNNSFKISAREFDVWMRLLDHIEGSVLWLLRDNDRAMTNLRREAERRGIDPRRLIFADRAAMADHLARHAHADLFLDSFTYNAHTTASDALWTGVPVVTRLGEGFAARVAASLLHALGVPELVTRSTAAYERLALELAKDAERLASLKDRIAQARLTSPLFDVARFARDLERGYDLAFDRLARGLGPDHIDIGSIASPGGESRIAA